MRLFILSILFPLLFESCAFDGDADDLVLQEIVVGNFQLQQHVRSNEIQLVYQNTPEILTPVISDCKTFSYDSANKMIILEEYNGPYASSYFRIKILDANSKYVSTAYNKTEISKSEFVTYMKRCNKCITRDFPKQQ
jgi:hypothetical protein